MSVFLLTDQHDRQLRVLRPFDETGVTPVASPLGLGAAGGLAVDHDGQVIVADTTADRLAIWDPWTGAWRTLGSSGDGDQQFSRPAAVAVDAANRIHVADAGNHRIVRVDDATGAGWAAFGTPGGPTPGDPIAAGMFRTPLGLAIDALGRLVVTDPGAGRAVRMDDLEGNGWTVVPLPAAAAPHRPLGVAAGPGWVAISDVGNRAVHVFDENDQLVASLDGAMEGLPVPAYLASDGPRLVVADVVANEVRRYRLDGATLAMGDRVRGSSPARLTPLFQEIGGIASGGR